MEPRINQCSKAFRNWENVFTKPLDTRRNYERKHITDVACPSLDRRLGREDQVEASPCDGDASSWDGEARPQSGARALTTGLGVSAAKNLGRKPWRRDSSGLPSLFLGVPCCRHFPAGPHMHKRQWEAPLAGVSPHSALGAFLPGKEMKAKQLPTVCKQECRTPSSSRDQ